MTMQAEVVIEGVLELGKKPTSTARKDWKPRLFVLKWYPTTERSTLDYYKDIKKRWQKQEAVGVVSLWPSFEVSLAHSCPYKFTIQLQTAESLLYLACDTEDTMMQWLGQIQMQRKLSPKSDLHVYPVCIQDNAHSRQMGVKEDCSLAISAKEILCALPSSNEVMGVWPLGMLRRYWCEDGVFGFEAGRHSPRGVGTYLFTTSQDKEIYDMLKRLTTQGDTAALGTRPPAPLPPTPVTTKSTTLLADPIRGGALMDRKEFKDDDEKKYDVVSEPPPVLPPKPLLKSQSEILVHKSTLIDPSLDLSPAYGHAIPPVSNSNPSASIVTNTLYGSSMPVPPLAGNQATPNNQATLNNQTTPNNQATPNNQFTPNTLKRRWLHESITPKVEPDEPAKDSLHFGTSVLKVSKWVQSTHAQAPAGVPQHVSLGVASVCEDSAYAHTVHRMPAEFELSEVPSVTLGPTLYNTLVHKGAQPHAHNETPPSTVRDQQSLYDIAFMQSGSNSKPSSKSDYSVAYLPQDQVDGATIVPQPMAVKERVEGGASRCSPSPMPPMPPMSPMPPLPLQDDGLTNNPLYGSQSTVIQDVLSLKISTPELHKRVRVLQDGPMGEAPFPENPNGSGGMLSDGDQLGPRLEVEVVAGSSTKDSGEAIQRDSKGYSKVAKSSLVVAEDNSAPPPLPERHYD